MSHASVKSNLPGPALPFIAGIFAWCIPGAGHWIIGERKRAAVIFVSLTIAFVIGIFLGSIAVIEIKSPWFYAQILFSPIAAYIGHLSGSVLHLESFGRPREIGEIYTGIAGMMNLLCIVNAVYLAHKKKESV
ncbi:MAG: DUF6677 family protein [Phycisphaerales bacterium]